MEENMESNKKISKSKHKTPRVNTELNRAQKIILPNSNPPSCSLMLTNISSQLLISIWDRLPLNYPLSIYRNINHYLFMSCCYIYINIVREYCMYKNGILKRSKLRSLLRVIFRWNLCNVRYFLLQSFFLSSIEYNMYKETCQNILL